MSAMLAKLNPKDLIVLTELYDTGKVRPILDKCFPLSDIAEALRYLESGHARGKVVVTMEHKNNS